MTEIERLLRALVALEHRSEPLSEADRALLGTVSGRLAALAEGRTLDEAALTQQASLLASSVLTGIGVSQILREDPRFKVLGGFAAAAIFRVMLGPLGASVDEPTDRRDSGSPPS